MKTRRPSGLLVFMGVFPGPVWSDRGASGKIVGQYLGHFLGGQGLGEEAGHGQPVGALHVGWVQRGGEHDNGVLPCQKQPLARSQKLETAHDGQVNVEENQVPVVERQAPTNALARSSPVSWAHINQQRGFDFSSEALAEVRHVDLDALLTVKWEAADPVQPV